MSPKQLTTNEPCYELSPMQSGMLFQAVLCERDGKSSGFDIEQLHLVLKEELNWVALQSAFDQITARHSILSTSFHWESLEHPKQLINTELSVPIELENWSDFDADQRARRLADFYEPIAHAVSISPKHRSCALPSFRLRRERAN